MRKFFAMLLLVVALGGFTIGCSGSAAPAPSGDDAAAPADSGADADAATEGSAGGGEEAPAEG